MISAMSTVSYSLNANKRKPLHYLIFSPKAWTRQQHQPTVAKVGTWLTDIAGRSASLDGMTCMSFLLNLKTPWFMNFFTLQRSHKMGAHHPRCIILVVPLTIPQNDESAHLPKPHPPKPKTYRILSARICQGSKLAIRPAPKLPGLPGTAAASCTTCTTRSCSQGAAHGAQNTGRCL